MYRTAAEIVFTVGVVVATLTDTASAQNSSGSAALDTSLRGAVERKDVPGVVALITDRERVLYQGAFGVADVATGRPLTTDAIFRIASMTKPVTSVALMQLVEQGRLSLDDPAGKYLPELAELKVFESFDPATGAYKVRPIKTGDGQTLPDAHVRIRLSVHQRELARFQAARRRKLSVRRTAAVRSGRALALRHQH
jgi:CubicO group peptidase (beta-lactamase class C family)